MKHQLTTGVLVRGRDDGPASWAMGSLFERLASGQETEGAFGLSLVTQPPGSDGQPPDEEIRRWIELGPRYGLRVIGPPIPAGS